MTGRQFWTFSKAKLTSDVYGKLMRKAEEKIFSNNGVRISVVQYHLWALVG